MAFKYLSWALFPLVIGYACYLLMYHEQKSWYSFCLSTVYGFLLTFGKKTKKFFSRVGCNKKTFSSLFLRLYYDDSTIIYQLQIEIRVTSSLAYDDLQSLEHIH